MRFQKYLPLKTADGLLRNLPSPSNAADKYCDHLLVCAWR